MMLAFLLFLFIFYFKILFIFFFFILFCIGLSVRGFCLILFFFFWFILFLYFIYEMRVASNKLKIYFYSLWFIVSSSLLGIHTMLYNIYENIIHEWRNGFHIKIDCSSANSIFFYIYFRYKMAVFIDCKEK